jgi:hypothetical protein
MTKPASRTARRAPRRRARWRASEPLTLVVGDPRLSSTRNPDNSSNGSTYTPPSPTLLTAASPWMCLFWSRSHPHAEAAPTSGP